MRRAVAACCLLGAVGLPGCTGSGEGQSAFEGPRIGQPTQLVQCRDWEKADPQERRGTIEVLREFAGGRTGSPKGRGATLDDDDAYNVLDGWCSQPYARGFRLYKLYTRAAAFQSLAE